MLILTRKNIYPTRNYEKLEKLPKNKPIKIVKINFSK